MEGLTTEEVEIAVVTLTGLLPGAEVETGETETGAVYVVAMREEPDGGLETPTVCRERGRCAVLDMEGGRWSRRRCLVRFWRGRSAPIRVFVRRSGSLY